MSFIIEDKKLSKEEEQILNAFENIDYKSDFELAFEGLTDLIVVYDKEVIKNCNFVKHEIENNPFELEDLDKIFFKINTKHIILIMNHNSLARLVYLDMLWVRNVPIIIHNKNTYIIHGGVIVLVNQLIPYNKILGIGYNSKLPSIMSKLEKHYANKSK